MCIKGHVWTSHQSVIMEHFTDALRKDALKFATLPYGLHHIKCIKPMETKYGQSYIMLIGDDLTPYWSNQYMKKCCSGIDTSLYQDSETKYLVNNGYTIATVDIQPSKSGKYDRQYIYNLLPCL